MRTVYERYARGMSQTTIRVGVEQRNALARIAADRNVTMDEALRMVLFEHRCRESYARLAADPAAFADYEHESDVLGNAATEVVGR
jgi:thymidylate kinase